MLFRNRVIALIAAICMIGSVDVFVEAQTSRPKPKPIAPVAKQPVAKPAINETVQREVGLRCAVRNNATYVTQVTTDSEAASVGIEAGDRVVEVNVTPDEVQLTLDHAGHPFKAILSRRTDAEVAAAIAANKQAEKSSSDAAEPEGGAKPKTPFSLGASHFGASANERSNGPLVANISSDDAKLLSSYHIELLIDRSVSMKRTDCGHLSRWKWCENQSENLAQALSSYNPQGLTITVFGKTYEVFPGAKSEELITIFKDVSFQEQTKLAEPLTERFNDYFEHRGIEKKRLLIVIITDGVPTPNPQPILVRQELIDASKYMHDPREVTVVFLQIGGKNPRGQGYLASLDADLKKDGAKYDFVHTKMFDQIETKGLAHALVQSVNESLAMTKPKLDPVLFSGVDRESYQNNMRRFGIGR